MLILIAKFRTKSECREKLISMSKAMVEHSRSEDGCIVYDFLQDPFDPDSFTFYERWRSREDLDLHFEKSYFKEFAGICPDLLETPGSIVAYEVAGENTIG